MPPYEGATRAGATALKHVKQHGIIWGGGGGGADAFSTHPISGPDQTRSPGTACTQIQIQSQPRSMSAIPLCNGGLSTTSLHGGHQHQPASLQTTPEPPATNRQTTSHPPAHGDADDHSQSQSQSQILGLCQMMVYLYLQVPLAGCQRRPNGEHTGMALRQNPERCSRTSPFPHHDTVTTRLSAPHKTIGWSVSGCTNLPNRIAPCLFITEGACQARKSGDKRSRPHNSRNFRGFGKPPA